MFAVQMTTSTAGVNNVREQKHKERPLRALNAARTIIVIQDKYLFVLNYALVSPNIQFKPFFH